MEWCHDLCSTWVRVCMCVCKYIQCSMQWCHRTVHEYWSVVLFRAMGSRGVDSTQTQSSMIWLDLTGRGVVSEPLSTFLLKVSCRCEYTQPTFMAVPCHTALYVLWNLIHAARSREEGVGVCAVYVGCSVCDCVCQEEGGRGREGERGGEEKQKKRPHNSLHWLICLVEFCWHRVLIDKQRLFAPSNSPTHFHSTHCRPHTAVKIFASNFLANKCGVSFSAEIELLQLKYIEWEKGGCC